MTVVEFDSVTSKPNVIRSQYSAVEYVHSPEIRVPNLFIAGAAKAGTTSLFRYLGQHSDIFMSPVKEPNFFNRDLTFQTNQMDEAAYFQLFSDWRAERWAGEGSVWYLYSAEAAARIAAMSPEAHIIILLRNPVDMAYAHHNQLLISGNQDISNFRHAFHVSETRKQGKKLPRRYHILETLFYRDVVRLTPQVKRYFAHFDRAQIHIILFDDLCEDPAAVVAGCHEFLGIRPMLPDLRPRNTNRNIRNHRLNRLLRNRRVANFAQTMVPNATLYNYLHRGFSDLRRKLLITRGKRPQLSDALRQELKQEVAADILELEELIDRDLSHWLK